MAPWFALAVPLELRINGKGALYNVEYPKDRHAVGKDSLADEIVGEDMERAAGLIDNLSIYSHLPHDVPIPGV